MKCISCNRKLEQGIGHYRTNSGPVCVVCHDKEIESDELRLKNNFQELSESGIMKDSDEPN
jgi:hypothetical protein